MCAEQVSSTDMVRNGQVTFPSTPRQRDTDMAHATASVYFRCSRLIALPLRIEFDASSADNMYVSIDDSDSAHSWIFSTLTLGNITLPDMSREGVVHKLTFSTRGSRLVLKSLTVGDNSCNFVGPERHQMKHTSLFTDGSIVAQRVRVQIGPTDTPVPFRVGLLVAAPLSSNKYLPKHVPVAPGLLSAGGMCKCPDGQTYEVSAIGPVGSTCNQVGCFGGGMLISGVCAANAISAVGIEMQVTCASDSAGSNITGGGSGQAGQYHT